MNLHHYIPLILSFFLSCSTASQIQKPSIEDSASEVAAMEGFSSQPMRRVSFSADSKLSELQDGIWFLYEDGCPAGPWGEAAFVELKKEHPNWLIGIVNASDWKKPEPYLHRILWVVAMENGQVVDVTNAIGNGGGIYGREQGKIALSILYHANFGEPAAIENYPFFYQSDQANFERLSKKDSFTLPNHLADGVVAKQKTYDAAVFFGTSLRGSDFSGVTFKNSVFSRVDFTGANFEGAKFENSVFFNVTCPDGMVRNTPCATNSKFVKQEFPETKRAVVRHYHVEFDSKSKLSELQDGIWQFFREAYPDSRVALPVLSVMKLFYPRWHMDVVVLGDWIAPEHFSGETWTVAMKSGKIVDAFRGTYASDTHPVSAGRDLLRILGKHEGFKEKVGPRWTWSQKQLDSALTPGVTVNNVVAKGLSLSGQQFDKSSWFAVDLKGADLTNTTFKNSVFSSVDLTNVRLDGAVFENTLFLNVTCPNGKVQNHPCDVSAQSQSSK